MTAPDIFVRPAWRFARNGIMLHVPLTQLLQRPVEIRAQAGAGFRKLDGAVVGRQDFRQLPLDSGSRLKRQSGFVLFSRRADLVLDTG